MSYICDCDEAYSKSNTSKTAYIQKFNDIFTEKNIYMCGNCNHKISRKDKYCKFCGATLINHNI